MVCTYCRSETKVVNSRPQIRTNCVWRRRKCLGCGAIISTIEATDYAQAWMVRRTISRPITTTPFSRDALLVSVYDSLRHRPTALDDATALTKTIITRLEPFVTQAILDREHIVATVHGVLSNFDSVAATHYKAFHA